MAASMSPAVLEAILNGPALKPPTGVKSNFTDPYTFGSTALILQIIFLVLVTLAMTIRTYTRVVILRTFQLHDYVAVLAWLLYVSMYIPTRLGSSKFYGIHQWDVQVKDLGNFLYYLHVVSVMYGITVFFIKLSILLQYLEIFAAKTRGIFFWTCHALIWLNFAVYVISTFMEIFPCSPLSKSWDPLLAHSGHCAINVLVLNVVAAAANSLSDIIILILPQPVIWNLQMHFKKRLAVSAVFSIGLLASVAATIRLYYTVELLYSKDITWYSSQFGLYVFPELSLGIITGCLPAFPKFISVIGNTALFSRIGTTLNSLLGFTKNGSGAKSGISKTPTSGSRTVEKKRGDQYNMLPEGHELSTRVGKTSTDGSTESTQPMNSVPPNRARVTRTVHISTTSRDLDQELGRGPPDQRPW